MSEGRGQAAQSPLRSERGTTRIKDSVVKKIAGRAAQEVAGVHMGGGASRAAGGLMQRAPGTGSSGAPGDMTRGVSAEVGEFETAIDLKMDIEYGRNIIATVEQVRNRITDQVGYMTGLRITELNATVNDVIPASSGEGSGRRRLDGAGSRPELSERYEPLISPQAREFRPGEIRPGIREEGTVEVEPESRTHTDLSGRPAPEEVRVEERPLEEGETAELRPGATDEAEPRIIPSEERGARGERETTEERPTGRSGGRNAFETRTDRGEERGAGRDNDEDEPPRARRRRRDR